jgi:exopolyphosphatase/guanosine-5'-triphosphate,3'-diphosphate pyrophosphatase
LIYICNDFLQYFHKILIKINTIFGLNTNRNILEDRPSRIPQENKSLKLAAVDIGSNAIRFQVTSVLTYKDTLLFKKLEYVRFPLRLGEDVFLNGEIGPEKEAKFIKLMHTFKNLFELYEVNDYVICATSAMRESKNGRDIAFKVKELLGVEINIIDGDEEANLINRVLMNEISSGSTIHIDVGGGSTEINIFVDKVKIATKSFKIGSVRRLRKQDSPEEWTEMEKWIKSNSALVRKPITAIGTGGNIGKIYELSELAQSRKFRPHITLKKIDEIIQKVEALDYEERINVLMLNPDRADVIIPASEIYTSAMKWSGATDMIVPEVGLKDGLMLKLFDRNKADFLGFNKFENTNKYQK